VIPFVGPARVMNQFFFPQAALDQWVVDERVEVKDGELTVLGPARRYKLAEAIRIVREVAGSADRHDLVGRVKARGKLEQLGAEIIESSMLLGDAAYDVEPGWTGVPVGPSSRPDDEILASLALAPEK
jgi:hypothetical protein